MGDADFQYKEKIEEQRNKRTVREKPEWQHEEAENLAGGHYGHAL
jgi:hypothetical protein